MSANPAPCFRSKEFARGTGNHGLRATGGRTDIVICGALAFVISITLSWILQPVPAIHDEFSYLLAGDTFASGRVANDPHPFWKHFESMHVLQQPQYASKYPPMQGLFLATGQVIANNPLAGVWFSTSLAAAAVCWMLQGWVTRRWALPGGLIAVFHSGLQLTWGQSYMGGAAAVIGSALLYGALPRWQKDHSWVSSLTGATGLAILANSRPFEGLLVSLPVIVLVCQDIVAQMISGKVKRTVIAVIPGMGVLVLTLIAMSIYNQRITGNCFQLPYSLHSRQYMAGPTFLCHSPPARQPEYHNAEMKTFHTGWAIDSYIAQRTIGGFLRVKSSYFSVATFVLLNPLTLIAVIFGVWAWWKSGPSSLNVIMTALAILIVGASSSVWLLPHYLAPGLPLLLNLAIHGLRHFRIYLSQTRGQHSRIFNGLALAYVVFFAAQCAYCAVAKDHSWSYERERIADNLARQEGQHLVFVQYGPHHSPHDEWVYNKAEIDAASVVWARDLGAEANDRLMQYFSGRKIWKIAVDSTPAHLIPVERAGITQSAAVGTSEL